MADHKSLHILVTGANGYIGGETAKCLRRNGHTVYGLIRKQEHAAELEKHEIIPVIGGLDDAKSFADLLNKVTVVIDNVLSYSKNQDPCDTNRALLSLFATSAKSAKVKKRYIYTSGCLVYGDYPNVEVEEDESKFPLKGTGKSRINFEKEVTGQTDVEGVVARPGFVYGLSFGAYLDEYWTVNKDGKIEIVGNPNKSWSWIHISDLATAYTLLAEAEASKVSGQIFDIGDDTRLTVRQVKQAMVLAAGAAKLKENETQLPIVEIPVDQKVPFLVMCEASTVLSAKKIRNLLGWKPRHQFLNSLDVYFKSYKASKSKQ